MSSLSIYSHLFEERSVLKAAADDVQLLSSDSRLQGIGTKCFNGHGELPCTDYTALTTTCTF